VDVRVTPDPDRPEVVLAAVKALLSRDGRPEGGGYRSAWRARGIRENVEDDLDDQGEAGRPRSSPGATRA
jgi:hypothetical protein